jgi:hypothetical protein
MSKPSLIERFRRINQRSLFGPGTTAGIDAPASLDQVDDGTPLAQARAEAVQRLQVGTLGIGAMVLLVGLASIISNQADLTEDAAVPEAAATAEPTPAAPQNNPLADAGVVPDIAADPAPAPPQAAPLDLPAPPADAAPEE